MENLFKTFPHPNLYKRQQKKSYFYKLTNAFDIGLEIPVHRIKRYDTNLSNTIFG